MSKSQRWKQFPLSLLTLKMLSMRSLYHSSRWSIRYFTWNWLSDWRKELCASTRKSQIWVLNLNALSHPCTNHSEGVSGETNHGNVAPISLQPRLGPAWLRLVYPSRQERTPFWDLNNVQTAVTCDLKEILVQAFQAATTHGRAAGNDLLIVILKICLYKHIL